MNTVQPTIHVQAYAIRHRKGDRHMIPDASLQRAAALKASAPTAKPLQTWRSIEEGNIVGEGDGELEGLREREANV
jgi:hypothetical protein